MATTAVEPARSSALAVHIWTVQLARWREARKLGIPMLDITAKSGNPAFAPDYSRVMDYKWGVISQERYTQLYIDRMRRSLREQPEEWEKLKEQPKVALACYCRPGEYCHRHLFKELMEKYLTAQGMEVKQMGEIAPQESKK